MPPATTTSDESRSLARELGRAVLRMGAVVIALYAAVAALQYFFSSTSLQK